MSNARRLKRLLDAAQTHKKEYKWLEAAELYAQALGAVGKRDFLKKGEVQERIGYCFQRAAFQAESQEEFKERMERAVGAHEKAQTLYEKLTDKQKAARMFRCQAIVKHLGYWLTSDPSEKRKLLDESMELKGKASAGFLDAQNILEYGKTYQGLWLLHAFLCRSRLEWNGQTLRALAEKEMKWNEKAVAVLTERGDSSQIAEAYITYRTCLEDLQLFIAEPEEQEKHQSKMKTYARKAVEFSEKAGDAHLLGWSHLFLRTTHDRVEECIKYSKKALECGEQARDNFLIAASLDDLAFNTYWKARSIEDPEERRKLLEKVLHLDARCQHHYSLISISSPTAGVITCAAGGHTEVYWSLAIGETDPDKRLELFEKAEKAGKEDLKLAKDLDMPLLVSSVLHAISKNLETRARIDLDPGEKASRLEKALKYREKAIEMVVQLHPFYFWDRGVMQNYLGEIKAELATVESDLEGKRRLLEEAALSKEKCLELCNKMMPDLEKAGVIDHFAPLQRYQDGYATLLTRLYNVTNNSEHLRKAIEISHKAIESASKLDMVSRVAESYWKIAKAQDILGEHLKAAEDFERSSESYLKAAERIPQLKDLYQDHARYMEAWSEIEKARHHHRRQEYGAAKEHFAKAADIHKSLKQWCYLTPNYSAWALVEHAEELSRKEQSEDALRTFEQAAQLFTETKESLQAELSKIETLDEKQMAANMLKATDLRYEYCMAKLALEEARILDKKGDHYSSSEKYGSATEIFVKISQAFESKRDQKEFTFLISLSKAWQKMTLAEAETSPGLYTEASEHFEEAKDLSPNEKSKMLMLGHSRFCKALEAGARFEDTRDATMYSAAKKHMEAAGNYYLKAGFKNASEYARGTHRLFDAYMYMHKAETETDPKRKAQYYQMAEKLLQSSAGSYMKANHPEKSGEVKTLLESVKEERQLAMSLAEVLHAPTLASATTSFSTPIPTHERAVGLERFEHVDMQAHLTISPNFRIEEEVDLRLDLVNVAKNAGLLVRVDKLVPPGFQVTASPSQHTLDDHSVDLKGKRLESLKVESIKLRLKALRAGVATVGPKVVYVDDVGKFRTCSLEPVTITVHPRLEFEFKTQAAQTAFACLTRAFVQDYMQRRLSLENSGWRTLMELVRQGKLSKSSVYGARGRRGPALSELERRGLVETRIFPGGRGRGGKIQKARLAYWKETIKRYIDRQVTKIREK